MKIGEKIPTFNLPDQDWNNVSDDELIGQPFVIYFYPKDDTPGCIKEACSFRDSFEDFQDAGAQVLGVSADTPEEHRTFIEKHRLPFVLLSDMNKQLQKAFHVPTNLFGLLPGRVTYVFNAKGELVYKFSSQLKAEKHAEESLKALNAISSN